jgi:hypothetical protein
VLVIGVDSSPMRFSIAIPCCFHRGLEIGEFFPRRRLELELRLYLSVPRRMEGIGRASAGRVLALLASLGREAGCAHWRSRAGSAGPHEKWKRGREKRRLAGPDSVSKSSAQYQIGTRKILLFFKSF